MQDQLVGMFALDQLHILIFSKSSAKRSARSLRQFACKYTDLMPPC